MRTLSLDSRQVPRWVSLLKKSSASFPSQIVATTSNGHKAVEYDKIAPLLIEAIKEQQAQIERLQAQIESLAADVQGVPVQ